MTTGAREAAALLNKALQPALTPVNDAGYRELLALYRGDADFSRMVDQMCDGLQLIILDVSERGLIVAPSDRNSRFSLRMTDLRQNLDNDQKVALLMAHLAVCAVFYPTTAMLEDEASLPLPASVARFRDTLLGMTAKLAQNDSPQADSPQDEAAELLPGWELLRRLPSVNPKGERASTSSVEGFVRLALNYMREYRLVRIEREQEDDTQTLYTPTHRLRVHLRELTWPRLFTLICKTVENE